MPTPRDAELAGHLKTFIARKALTMGSRLPPERDLCRRLGVTRAALRKALDVLEADGQIWRHVGKGTFVGNRPIAVGGDLSHIIGHTSPLELMEARLRIEPELAQLAALNATSSDLEQMERCLRGTRAAREWRVYETWDNNLHQAIAEATHNTVLLSLYGTLNTVRRAIVWGRPRLDKPVPDATHHSHAEHTALVEAIRGRNMAEAGERMRLHLRSVRKGLMQAYGVTG